MVPRRRDVLAVDSEDLREGLEEPLVLREPVPLRPEGRLDIGVEVLRGEAEVPHRVALVDDVHQEVLDLEALTEA